MHPFLDQLSGEQKEKLIERDQPDWVEPMLATLTDRRFSDRDWIFERKFDGERCLVFRKGDTVRLLSRNRKRLNDTYPELEQALMKVGGERFIADGEIVGKWGER